jgi:hypothetical protein
MKQRHWQQEVSGVDYFPAKLRADLWRTGYTWADKFRREEIFHAYRPKIATALAADHMATAGARNTLYHVPHEFAAAGTRVASTWQDAQSQTLAQHRQLQTAHLSRAFDETEIRDYADNYAGLCSKMKGRDRREDFVLSLGIAPPEGRKLTDAGACARMDDPQWWRRKLRVTWTRRAENVMRAIGIVRKGREPYASDDAVHHRHGQKIRGRRFLEGHAAVNEAGEQLNLLDVVEGSVSNPALRRAEFMTRVRGFEEIAQDAGHVAHFWTLTAPSVYHSQLAAGGKNLKYKGANVREAQAWLCKQWARTRAKLKRLSILYYGFRIAEPHHDGTPHWHLLMFCRERDAETIARVIRGYWLKEHAEELGAPDPRTGHRPRESARAKLITIDKNAGTAAGYVAKYVSKNIDGHGGIGEAEDWETGAAVNDGLRRVDAWASLHGVRQFQQIGGPPVGLWRELRRVTEVSDNPMLEKCRAAADAGDWRAFIYACNWQGIKAGRRDLNVKLVRQQTGERSKYAEEREPPVIGVRSGAYVEVTRRNTWRIEKCGKPSVHGAGRDTQPTRGANCSPKSPAIFAANLHPYGGLCGLGLGDNLRKFAAGKTKRKGRRRQHGVVTAGAAERNRAPRPVSGSSSSSSLRPWTRGNNCTRRADPKDAGRVFWKWEAWAAAWYRQHGRYPTLDETLQLTNKGGP